MYYTDFMRNPFRYGRVVLNSRELIGRKDELRALEETIDAGGKLFMIGPRRFGKTSLINAVTQKRRKKGDIILAYNAESFSYIEDLIAEIIKDSAEMLKGSNQKKVDKLHVFFKSLRPEISFSFTQTGWKVGLGVNPQSSASSQTKLFLEALNGLERLAADQKRGVRTALVIDEFQDLIEKDPTGAEKRIRSAIQNHKHAAYIFAGSNTRMIREMISNHKRPFYRLGQTLDIDIIPRLEFVGYIARKFTLGEFFPPNTTSEEKKTLALYIIELAEDVPHNVQMLAHTIWNELLQKRSTARGKPTLTRRLIRDTLTKLVNRQDATYTHLWNSLTANQKRALTAAVTENGQNLRSRDVTHRAKMSASTMQRALGSLTNQGLLREKGKGGSVWFHFEDPFFAHWIRLSTFLDS